MPRSDKSSNLRLDKNKIAATAQKFSDKGKFDKAILEYQKITLAEPENLRARLKIADLQARSKDRDSAATTYIDVARLYVDQGFSKKAVAVLQRVVALKPQLIDIHLWLAELLHERGLLGDVRQQFEAALKAYDEDVDEPGAIEVLQAIAELDPNHVAPHLRLAEIYARKERTAEAIAQFRRSADLLRASERSDAYVVVAERLLSLQPENLELTLELATLFLRQKSPRRAIGLLQICYEADPKNIETIQLLVSTFLELGQKTRAIASLKALAAVYGTNRATDLQRDTFQRILQLAPGDPEAIKALTAIRIPAPAGRAKSKQTTEKPPGQKHRPREATPKEATPKKATPKKATPKKATPKKATRKRAAPEQSAVLTPAAPPRDPAPPKASTPAEEELLDLKELENLTVNPEELESESAPAPQALPVPAGEHTIRDDVEPLDLTIEIEAAVKSTPDDQVATLYEEAKIYTEFGLYMEAADQVDELDRISSDTRETQDLRNMVRERAQQASDAASTAQAQHIRDSAQLDGGLAELLEPDWEADEMVMDLAPGPSRDASRDSHQSDPVSLEDPSGEKNDEPGALDDEFEAAFFSTDPRDRSG
jgi:tetratricopeptide (TPR) repeat protein